MTVYVLMVVNRLTQSEYVDSIYEDEEDALDQADIIKGNLEERFFARIEPQSVIERNSVMYHD